ncbi:16546_t:CDS:2, partial [Dentiscutata heterogama]
RQTSNIENSVPLRGYPSSFLNTALEGQTSNIENSVPLRSYPSQAIFYDQYGQPLYHLNIDLASWMLLNLLALNFSNHKYFYFFTAVFNPVQMPNDYQGAHYNETSSNLQ